jgi:flavin reductase (DIM6/NTAB) family NADH-FMN oxidoreductase RutF
VHDIHAAAALDGKQLRGAYSAFPSGVVALCARVGDESIGMAVSAFMPVSLDPPLVGVCIQKTSSTWPRLRGAGILGVSVLRRTQGQAARQLASKGVDRFANIPCRATAKGALVLSEAETWFECAVYEESAAGDHAFVLLRVLQVSGAGNANDPMVFHGSEFKSLLHGASAPPTLDGGL